MTNITIKCKVCGEELRGVGHQMCRLSENHLKDKHKEDWLMIDELEIKLRQIKDKYGLYLYGTY